MQSSDKLLSSLKLHNPAKVRCYVGDDDHKDIAVTKRRKKWAQVVAAVEGATKGQWSRCELLDGGGALLATVENTDPAGELSTIGGGPGTGRLGELMALVQIVTKAQRDAMQFRDNEVQALLRAQGEVVRELTAGVKALSAMYQEQVKAVREVAELQAEAQVKPDQSELQQLLEAAPAILQVLPMLKNLTGGGQVQ
jgi:ribosomal protein S6